MESFIGEEWSPLENEKFEEALAEIDLDGQDWLEQLNETLPTKVTEELADDYIDLTGDLGCIDNGRNLTLPNIASSNVTKDGDSGFSLMDNPLQEMNVIGSSSSKTTMVAKTMMEGGSSSSIADEVITLPSLEKPKAEKQPLPMAETEVLTKAIAPASTKGIPWTEEEHRLFLIGMDVHGRGDWRHIAKNFVTTRTPTQVASHAQKFFQRQLQFKKRHRRSIHDITSINSTSPTKIRKLSVYDLIEWKKPLDIPNANHASQSNSPFLHQQPANYSMAHSQISISTMIAGVGTSNANNISQLSLPSLPQTSTNYTMEHSQFPVSHTLAGVGTLDANNISQVDSPSLLPLPESYIIEYSQFPVSHIMTGVSPSISNNLSQFDSPSLLQPPASYTMEHLQFPASNMMVEGGTSNTNNVSQFDSLSLPQPPVNYIVEHSKFLISNIDAKEGEERASLVAPTQLADTFQQTFGIENHFSSNMMIGPSFTSSSTSSSTMWSL
ncbi:uncharacterized protein LOC120104301 [Phoenix dactylifera]|uniref:Uncharacterized protein LOC120104301 n=1 Tax=Phoenix dactylifera TaxID=42345 RepID=A0A8B8ZCX2_PHODC|nr:uncharacterized protein LOC120104301 [Phoenix dactylifera]